MPKSDARNGNCRGVEKHSHAYNGEQSMNGRNPFCCQRFFLSPTAVNGLFANPVSSQSYRSDQLPSNNNLVDTRFATFSSVEFVKDRKGPEQWRCNVSIHDMAHSSRTKLLCGQVPHQAYPTGKRRHSSPLLEGARDRDSRMLAVSNCERTTAMTTHIN